MSEYVLGVDENPEQTVRELLAHADDPASVVWSPRPDVPHGGVYVIPDALSEKVLAARQAVRDAQAKQIQQGLDFAEQRDSHDAVVQGLATPAEAGFPAAVGNDPGAPGTETGPNPLVPDDRSDEERAQDAADAAVVDDPSTPQDEKAEADQRAEERRAARKAARAKSQDAPAVAQDTEGK